MQFILPGQRLKTPVSDCLMVYLIFPFLGYLVGSISSAVLVCKLLGLPDPRHEGSGNPGATNVLRIATIGEPNGGGPPSAA